MKKIILLFLFSLYFLSCQEVKPQIPEEKEKISSIEKSIQSDETVATLGKHRIKAYPGTLDEIKRRKFVRFLTTNNSFNYFVHNGTQKGYEYEMAKDFVHYLNKKLGIKEKNGLILFEMVPVRRDELLTLLAKGYGDIAAAGITATVNRKKEVSFTVPYNSVHEVAILNKSLKGVNTIEHLSGKKVVVRKSSSYNESLLKINEEFIKKSLPPIKIILMDEGMETETIIELVSLGKFDLTISDSHIANAAKKIFNNIVVKDEIKLRENGNISWAVSKGATSLLEELNGFMPKYKKGSLMGNINLQKYFSGIKRIGTKSFDHNKKQLSQYDAIIKEYAMKYDWDWRILSALAYQESKFNQNEKNKWGAIGVFQIKNIVAKEEYINIPDIEGPENARNNIHAGTKYLSWLRKTYFSGPGIEEKDRIRLSLAAYNAGPGRLKQAAKKAVEMDLNPNKWLRNIEYALLAMGKTEPVNYVNNINSHFLAYAIIGF